MAFTKPLQDLTFDDIEALVDSEEPEGITLEYKREIDRSPDGKRELAKDVSAMANSQGGYLIIGIAEEDHRPVMPDEFVPRMLGQQKVEEWLEQVLNSNIAQRVSVHIKPIPVSDQADECAVVIHIPQSPRVPHMVTTEGQKRYYVRHNFQTLPAEEYEVRDMFERGRRMRDEVRSYLKNRGFQDPDDDPQFEFAANSLTRKLGVPFHDEDGTWRVDAADTRVCFVACPWLLGECLDTSGEEFRSWFKPAERHYHPPARFLPYHECRDTLHGALRLNKVGRLLPVAGDHDFERYLGVHRNGYVEYAYGSGRQSKGLRIIHFVGLIGRFWQFMGFVRDLYQSFDVPTNALVALNMANVEGTDLAQFGRGWAEPWELDFPTLEAPSRSLDAHIWIPKEVDFHSLDEEGIEAIVRDVAARVGSAYGQQEPQCFRREDGKFPVDVFGIWDR